MAVADTDVFFSQSKNVPASLGISIGSVVLHEIIAGHSTFAIECSGLDAGDPTKLSGSQPSLDKLIQQMGVDVFIVVRSPSRGNVRQQLDFHGLITRVRATRQRGGGQRVILEGHSRTIIMDEGHNYVHLPLRQEALFADSLLRESAKAIPGLVVFTLGDASKQIVDYGMVYHETLFNFMLRVAERAGVWCFYDGENFQVRDTLPNAQVQLTLDANTEENALNSFSIEAAHRLAATTIAQKQWGEEPTLTADSDTETPGGTPHLWADKAQEVLIGSKNKFDRDFPETRYRSQGELDLYMRIFNESTVTHIVNVHGTSSNAKVRLAVSVDLRGMAPEQAGAYVVGRVTHFMDAANRSYSNEFDATPASGARPPWTHNREPANLLLQGTVVDDVDLLSNTAYTKEFLDTVKVRLTFRREAHVRARVAMPYAGAKSGFFTMPEVGDEVVVQFVEGDPSRAVVVGSLFKGANSKVFKELHGLDKNLGKGLVTLGGNKILIQDGPGKSITISSPGSITISAGGSVSISAGADVTINAGKNYLRQVKVDSTCITTGNHAATAKNIAMLADEEMALKGKSASFVGTADTSVGSKKITIKGSDNVSIGDKEVLVEGSSKVEVKTGGSSMVTSASDVAIKGGQVKLNT